MVKTEMQKFYGNTFLVKFHSDENCENTVKFLKFRTSRKFAVIILKVEQDGFTLE